MIKYIKSKYPRGDINSILPPNVKVSIIYINKDTGDIIRAVESEDPLLIDQFKIAIDGTEVPKPASSISPIKLITLFPLNKIIEIRASTDPGIKTILNILDDPRLLEVDRNTTFFLSAIDYISSIIPLSVNEIQNILTGE